MGDCGAEQSKRLLNSKSVVVCGGSVVGLQTQLQVALKSNPSACSALAANLGSFLTCTACFGCIASAVKLTGASSAANESVSNEMKKAQARTSGAYYANACRRTALGRRKHETKHHGAKRCWLGIHWHPYDYQK